MVEPDRSVKLYLSVHYSNTTRPIHSSVVEMSVVGNRQVTGTFVSETCNSTLWNNIYPIQSFVVAIAAVLHLIHRYLANNRAIIILWHQNADQQIFRKVARLRCPRQATDLCC